MKKPLVIYHGNCYDGFSAAWVAKQAIPDAEFFAARYNDPPPDVQDRVVLMVDISYSRDILVAMLDSAALLRVLDHHKTAEAACAGLDFCTFDLSRSGARLAWRYFYPEMDPPDWLLRVEDRDLWRFAFDDTKAVHAYIASLPMTFENWDALNALSIADIAAKGHAIAGYIQTWCQKAAKEAYLTTLNDIPCIVVNVPYQNASEMGSVLLEQHSSAAFAVGYFKRADGRWQYSLRSRSDFDVSEVAKRYGGGGHPGAAGFDFADLLV